jgi:hypothetical protein
MILLKIKNTIIIMLKLKKTALSKKQYFILTNVDKYL